MTVNQKVEKPCYYLAVMLSIRAFFRDNLSLTKNKIETNAKASSKWNNMRER